MNFCISLLSLFHWRILINTLLLPTQKTSYISSQKKFNPLSESQSQSFSFSLRIGFSQYLSYLTFLWNLTLNSPLFLKQSFLVLLHHFLHIFSSLFSGWYLLFSFAPLFLTFLSLSSLKFDYFHGQSSHVCLLIVYQPARLQQHLSVKTLSLSRWGPLVDLLASPDIFNFSWTSILICPSRISSNTFKSNLSPLFP
jgi:hypothetical protein